MGGVDISVEIAHCVCEGVSLDLILESFQKKLRQFNFCDTFPSFGYPLSERAARLPVASLQLKSPLPNNGGWLGPSSGVCMTESLCIELYVVFLASWAQLALPLPLSLLLYETFAEFRC